MKTRIFITALVMLFTVNFASAQIDVSMGSNGYKPKGTPFTVTFTGETSTYVVAANVDYSLLNYNAGIYSINDHYNFNGGYGATASTMEISGTLNSGYSTASQLIPIYLAIYDSTTDILTNQTVWISVHFY